MTKKKGDEFMAIKKITISVPQKESKKWKLSFGKGERKRNSASVIFLAIEKRLQARAIKEKLAIRVKYTKDTDNETIPSQNAPYLLYSASCFLEDFLSKKVLKRIRKQYLI